MLTDLLIKALRPILVPLLLEALEQHARTHTNLRTFYVEPKPIRRSPMQGSP